MLELLGISGWDEFAGRVMMPLLPPTLVMLAALAVGIAINKLLNRRLNQHLQGEEGVGAHDGHHVDGQQR